MAGSGAGAGLDLSPGNKTGLTITVGADTRHYALQVPRGYDPKKCNPLLVFLHGTADTDKEVTVENHYIGYARWGATADAKGFLVALPVSKYLAAQKYFQWDDGGTTDQKFLAALTDHLIANAGVDPKRVYLAGFSSGAWMTSASLPRDYNRFAAFGIHAGGPRGSPSKASRKAGAYLYVGAADKDFIDRMRQLRDGLKSAGWVDGTNLSYKERAGLAHEYDASTNAEQWAFYSKFALP